MDRIQQRLVQLAAEIFEGPGEVTARARAEDRLAATLAALAAPLRATGGLDLARLGTAAGRAGAAKLAGGGSGRAPDLAAFVNGLALGPSDDPCSDLVPAVLAAAEQADGSEEDLLRGLALAEAVLAVLAPLAAGEGGLGRENLLTLAVATAAGRVLGLAPDALSQAIGLAATTAIQIPAAAGDEALKLASALRAGVFAALSAQAGMEGPVLPFEGKTGWCALVGRVAPDAA